jgi:hypothetical protein
MVENSGKTSGAGTYKPVNMPEQVKVAEDASGLPSALIVRRRQAVAAIEDRWRIDDEWWRFKPVSRFYFAILLASGHRLVLYKDLVTGDWYKQDL